MEVNLWEEWNESSARDLHRDLQTIADKRSIKGSNTSHIKKNSISCNWKKIVAR